MILVTGATGGVGGALVSRLSRAGVPARALVRSRARADDLRGYDVQIALGEFGDTASLREAAAGVSAVFLADGAGPDLAREERALVEVLAPGTRVVVLAPAGVEGDADVRVLAQHREVVAALHEAELPTTVLAAAPALQDLLGCGGAVQERGVLPSPTGDAPVAWVDARDVAAVAQHVLAGEGHEGATYVVTGPEALDAAGLAGALSRVLGREIGVEPVDEQAQRAALTARGLDDWTVEGTLEHDAWLRAGGVATVTDEVERATGRPPRTAEAFLREHASAFR